MARETVRLSVEGMSCQHCVKAVKQALGALPGVGSVDVSLERKQVTVEYDPGLSGLPVLKAAVEDAGYTVA